MNPILTPVERLVIENQVAMLDALSVICALIHSSDAQDGDRLEMSHMLHALAEDNRFVLEKSK